MSINDKKSPLSEEKQYSSDVYLKKMFDTSPHIIILFDSDFRVMNCNPAALRFMGFATIEEMLDGFQQRITESIPEFQDDGRHSVPLAERFMTALREGACKFDTKLILNGQTKHLTVEFIKTTNEDDFTIAAYVVDITASHEREVELSLAREQNEQTKMQLEEALKQSNSTLDMMTSIINKSEAMIFVADLETDEILFMSDHMKEHFNVSDDDIGKPCYKVLQKDKDGRCEFCPCFELDRETDKVVKWEERNSRTDKYYLKTDRYVDWPGGKKVHIQFVFDTSEMRETQENLVRREESMEMMNKMAVAFLSQSDIAFDELMSHEVGVITDSLGLDRITLWRNHEGPDGLVATMTYIWDRAAGGTTVPPEGIADFKYSVLTPTWEEIFKSGESVNGPSRLMTEPEAASLLGFGVVSSYATPVFITNNFWGFVLFEDRHNERYFDNETTEMMRSAAFLFVTAVNHVDMKNEVAQAEERVRLMLDSNPLCCQLWDSSLNKIDCNEEAIRLFGFKDKQDYLKRYPELYPEYQPDGELSTEKIARYIEKTIKEGRYVFNWTYKMPDGSLMPTEATLVRVKQGDGYAITGYTRDLREHNKMMNEIYRHQQELIRERERNELQLTKMQLMIKATRIGLWDMEVVLNDPVNPNNMFNWSDEFRHMIGYSDENDFPNILSSCSSRLHPDDSERTLNIFKSHLLDKTGQTPYDLEYRLMKKTGIYAHFRASGETIRDENGQPLRVAGALMDITESKMMTQYLNDAVMESHKTIEIMSSVLNSTDAMIYVSDIDTDELLFINDSMKHHFGIEGDVIGDNCFKVFNEGLTGRCDWCPCKELKKKPDEPIVWEELNSITKRYYRNTDRFIDWPGGKKVHIQHSVELTDIKQVQDELERNQKMLRAVNNAASFLLNSDTETFNNALNQGMMMIAKAVEVDRVRIWKNLTIEGELYSNQEYEWSGSLESFQGKKLTTNVSYKDKTPGWEAILSKGDCVNALVRDLPKSGQAQISPQGVMSLFLAPVFVEDQFWGYVSFDDCKKERRFTIEEESILRSGSVLFVNAWLRNEMVVSLRDTSIQLEAALKQAELGSKAKSDFLSTVSHEIRTPMNAILGITEIQLQNALLEHSIREAFDKIYISGDLLLGIINDILDLSKIEAGKLELIIETYEITSLISDAAQLNMMRIGSKPIEFELSVDENTPVLLAGDELRIKQIMNNLLSNAFKYTEEGIVKMSIHAEEGEDSSTKMIVFTVSDTGQGMTPEQLDKLFDEYSRFDASANRMTEGTGLGMSIVRNLIRMMDGEITIESQPGKGSTFTVKLPQGVAGPELLGKELAENLQQFKVSSGSHMKRVQVSREPMPYGSVLIVDDVDSNIYVARGLMAPYELKIDSADSGFAAIEKINNGSVYDIIFMDHMMPKMDGVEATRIIRKAGYRHPIVALTANAVIGQSDMFIANGFDDFIAKPVDVRQLNAVLNRLIRDKQPPEVIEEARQRAEIRMQDSNVKQQPKPDIDPKLSELFVQDARETLKQIEAFLDKGGACNDDDIQSYVISVHGIKGALSYVHEPELMSFADKLERAGKSGNIALISTETPTFFEKLRALVLKLTPQEEEGEEIELSDNETAYLREKLLIIKAACEVFDQKHARKALSELREKTWPPKIRQLLGKMAEQLINGDFDDVTSAADEIQNWR